MTSRLPSLASSSALVGNTSFRLLKPLSFSKPRLIRGVDCCCGSSFYAFESRRFFQPPAQTKATIEWFNPPPKQEDPNNPPHRLRNPEIPEGHPIDVDGRPLGHFIPDYDVEVPILSFGGYAKDFEAWTDPPVFPDTVWPKIAKYDYGELEVKDFPVVYEVNTAYVINVASVMAVLFACIASRWELKRYYTKYGEFYKTGWPLFHYEPNLDIVPLTPRSDGLPPETTVLIFDDPAMVRHEMTQEEIDEASGSD